ncbi:MAG: hypothetical protein OXN18_13060 [Gemmatimonadota bacterium]|nr:hypothetical protein [Gemmatimonadota bacterium]
MSGERIRVRLLYAEGGGYHTEVVSVPGGGFADYERLIDFLREDEAVAAECYIDPTRLCSAQLLEADEEV